MSWIMLVEYGACFAEVLIAFIFFKDFLGQKYKNILFLLGSAVLYILINTFMSFYDINWAMSMSVSALFFVSLTFLFNSNIKWKLATGFLFYVFIFLADFITMLLLMWTFNASPYALTDIGALTIFGLIISKILLFVITKTIGNLRKKDNTRLPLQFWIKIIPFPIISIIVLISIFDLKWRLQCTIVSGFTAIAIIGSLYINIFAFQLFEFFSERAERESREKLWKQQVSLQVKECERIQLENQNKMSFLHDLRHRSQALQKLVENGEADEALKLISTMIEKTYPTRDYVKSGNPTINAILNYQIAFAEDNDISVDFNNICIPSDVKLDTEDIIIIFANSLENAIEGNLRIADGEKYIKLSLVYQEEKLVYDIKNPTDGNVIKNKAGRFKSSKTNTGECGFGVENIERAVNKYDGMFWTEHNNNIFELGFSIPSKK